MGRAAFALDGRIAIVTGGSRGIGFGIAAHLVESGVDVVAVARDHDRLDAAVTRLSSGPGRAIGVCADVGDLDAGSTVAARCQEAFGCADILVNNAGIFPLGPFLEMDPRSFDDSVGVNLRGLYFFSQAVARAMIQHGTGGAIVNMASMSGAHPTIPGLSVYGATKSAVIQLTRNMALELAEHGIRVTSVSPGVIRTEGTTADGEDGASFLDARIPLGRRGTPADVANVVAFLASDAAAYVTGTNVLVDGGFLLT